MPAKNSGRSGASFIIQGVGLDLDAISQALNMKPSHIHHKGDKVFAFREKQYEHDMWSLSSPLEKDQPLDSHLKWLSQQLQPKYEYIRSLMATAEVYIFCEYTTEAEQSNFSLSPEALSIFKELSISMDLSILSI